MSKTYTIIERGSIELGSFGAETSPDRRALERLLKKPDITDRTDPILYRVGNRLMAGRYIGVIELRRGSRIEILPKLAKGRTDPEKAKAVAMHMIRRVYQLDNKSLRSAELKKSGLDIYELLIQMYLRELTRVIKRGLRSGYITEEDNLHHFKGKLVFSEHIRRNAAHRERFYMRYDSFSLNRPENRLLKSTALLLLDISVSDANRLGLRRQLAMMEDVEPSTNIAKDFACVVSDRTTADYRTLLNWSRFFLCRRSLDAFTGRETARSLLIPMEELFEKYVGKYLRKLYAKSGVKVTEQDSRYWLATGELATGEKEYYFRLRPDFVIESKKRQPLILDTKWKLLTSEKDKHFKISEKDMYQLFTYARAYGTTDVCLIYPKPLDMDVDRIPRCFDLPDSVKVHITFIDLAATDEDSMFKNSVPPKRQPHPSSGETP